MIPEVHCTDDSLNICNETAKVLRDKGKLVAVLDKGFYRAVTRTAADDLREYVVMVLP